MELKFSQLQNIYDNWDEPEYAGMFADILWRALLLSAVRAIIAVGSYAAQLFFGVTSELSNAGDQAKPASAPSQFDDDRAALTNTVNIYSGRKDAFQSLQASPPPASADPSQ